MTVPDNINEMDNTLKSRYIQLMTNVAIIMGAPGNLSNILESTNRVTQFEIGLLKVCHIVVVYNCIRHN